MFCDIFTISRGRGRKTEMFNSSSYVMQCASWLQYRCETIDIQIFHGRHGHVIILRWCRCERQKKNPLLFSLENGGENKLEFFQKQQKKIKFFLTKKRRKNCFNFFSPLFFQKQQNFFFEIFCRLSLCKLVICLPLPLPREHSLFEFNGMWWPICMSINI